MGTRQTSQHPSWPNPSAAVASTGIIHLSNCHDVLVIAVHGDGVLGEGAGGHMQYAWRQLPRNLEHPRDHEQKTLDKKWKAG